MVLLAKNLFRWSMIPDFSWVIHLPPFSFFVILGTEVAVLTYSLHGWTPDPFLASGRAAAL